MFGMVRFQVDVKSKNGGNNEVQYLSKIYPVAGQVLFDGSSDPAGILLRRVLSDVGRAVQRKRAEEGSGLDCVDV